MAEVHNTSNGVSFHNPNNQNGTHPLPVSAGKTVTVNTTSKAVHGDLGNGNTIGSLVFDNPS